MNVILHVDANNFYASVAIKNNPTLKGKPLIICGDPEKRHGIVLAKSNEAKKLGIKTTQTISEAKKICKNLICLPPDYQQYKKYSEMLFEIYKRFTPLVESFGMDECWLDVSGSIKLYGTPYEIANQIRSTVKNELGITVSVGVSFTKTFAKLGSDLKKPDAITVIDKSNYKQIAWNLPADHMIYIGDSAKLKLKQMGISTIGDIAQTSPIILERELGKTGKKLYNYANGTDDEKVGEYYAEHIPESISNGSTCEEDIITERAAKSIIYSLGEAVAFRLRKYGLLANGIGVSVKNNEFEVFSRQTKISVPTSDAGYISRTAFENVIKNCKISKDNPLRTITVCVYNLTKGDEIIQDSLFNSDTKKSAEVNRKLDTIRNKYGYSILKKAIELEETFKCDHTRLDNTDE